MKTDSRFMRFLGWVERKANKLPHPTTIFVWLFAIFAIISALGAALNWNVSFVDNYGRFGDKVPGAELSFTVKSFFSRAGILWIFSNLIKNFTTFPPLGVVIVIMLGIGVMEQGGFFDTLIKKTAKSTPDWLLPYTIAFIGIMSNIASDAGYVVLIPLAGILYKGVGKNPLAGMAVAFAGVSAGFSANLLVTSVDALLVGISNASGAINVSLGQNHYFMIASTFVLTFVCGYISTKIVEPALGQIEGSKEANFDTEISASARRGLKITGIGFLLFIALCVFLAWPGGILNHGIGANGEIIKISFLKSQFLKKIVPILWLMFTILGLCYGFGSGTFKNDKDVVAAMNTSMRKMGPYLTLAFFASQFINLFTWSNLHMIISVKGADLLKALNLTGQIGALIILVVFILLSALINLFIGSASAKWAIMAPIFIPMFLQLGISTDAALVAYRIADSTTNIISPLMSYFAIIVVFAQVYDKKAGIGTIMKMMVPYSLIMLGVWTLMFIIWFLTGLPFGW